MRYNRNGTNYNREQYRLEMFCMIGFILVFLFMGVLSVVNSMRLDNVVESTPPIITESPSVEPTPEPTQDYDEMGKINAALVESGYLRDDVPLSYELQDTLRTVCDLYNIDYCLMLGLIQLESNFNENAVSSIGAYGLMQLNPKYFPANLNSHENITYGVGYFVTCLMNNEYDIPAALRSYNAGHDDGDRVYANTVMAYAEEWRLNEKYMCG